MSAAERTKEIRERLDLAEGDGWAIDVLPDGLKVSALGDGPPPAEHAARFLIRSRTDADWLLGALQATAEAFSAVSNYSLGFDWREYVVEGGAR